MVRDMDLLKTGKWFVVVGIISYALAIILGLTFPLIGTSLAAALPIREQIHTHLFNTW